MLKLGKILFSEVYSPVSKQDNLVLKKRLEKVFVNKDLRDFAVFVYDETDSTNTRAKLFAENADAGAAIFVSRAQSAGRGTRARAFESPADKGVYISFLIKPEMPLSEALIITSYAAITVCHTLEKYSHTPDFAKIKWVNDIYAGQRKLAGILTEGKASEGGMCEYAIVGIGINIQRGAHSEDVDKIMAALCDFGLDISFEELCVALSEEFFSSLHLLDNKTEIMREYRHLSCLIGKSVIVSCDGEEREELAFDIDESGALITKDKNGNLKRYISADVSAKPKSNNKQ